MHRCICFLIALLALNSITAQVTVREINHDCNATCKGRITWELVRALLRSYCLKTDKSTKQVVPLNPVNMSL